MVTDQISDLLTRIRNAAQVGHPTVSIPASHTKERILDVLRDEGYIHRYEPAEDSQGHKQIKAFLKYDNSGKPVIKELTRMSSPGKRYYVGKDDVPTCRGGLGLVIVSTSRGMMSDRAARKEGIGGELICSVF